MVEVNFVRIKFKDWSSEHEFIELSTQIYVLDNGCRKENPPFVLSDNNGRVDKYTTEIGPDAKMRCYMVKRLVLPGYGNDEKYTKKSVSHPFEHFFGKSYRQLLSFMIEHNYEKLDEGICSLNFYEI